MEALGLPLPRDDQIPGELEGKLGEIQGRIAALSQIRAELSVEHGQECRERDRPRGCLAVARRGARRGRRGVTPLAGFWGAKNMALPGRRGSPASLEDEAWG
jgi:hypothetical protein